MTHTSSTTTLTSLHPETTVGDVVDLLERYAAADRELTDAIDRLGAETSSSRRVCQNTVSRLFRLLDQSLVPGVQAKAELDVLPARLREAGIVAWACRATSHVAPQPIDGTA